MPPKKILVTGCGRSGTQFTWKILNSLGIEVGHEKMERNGTVDWTAVSWEPQRLNQFDLILHQVRHPLKVISSWHTVEESHPSGKWAWGFLYNTLSIPPEMSLLEKLMIYWLHWNLRAEEITRKTYQVERFMQEVPEVVSKTFDLPSDAWTTLVLPPENIHSTSDRETYRKGLCWEHLEEVNFHLAFLIKSLAQRYGYSV